MKYLKISYWITTTLFFLFDSVMTAFTFNTPLAKEGISHLGYPDYFRIELSVFKIIGGVLLILPMVKPKYKEWAYVGFGISIVSAITAHWVVDGLGMEVGYALIILIILLISYYSYHKLLKLNAFPTQQQAFN